MLRDKEKLVREYHEDLKMRDTEVESMKIRYEDELKKKERERTDLKFQLENRQQQNRELERDIIGLERRLEL